MFQLSSRLSTRTFRTLLIFRQKLKIILLLFIFKLILVSSLFYFNGRLSPESPIMNLRLFLSNESGYSLDIHTYQEVQDPKTGKTTFKSYGDKQGPYDGLPITTPYVTKDNLQVAAVMLNNMKQDYFY